MSPQAALLECECDTNFIDYEMNLAYDGDLQRRVGYPDDSGATFLLTRINHSAHPDQLSWLVPKRVNTSGSDFAG